MMSTPRGDTLDSAEAQDWAASEASILQNFLSNGVDNWDVFEHKMLAAQESMNAELEQEREAQDNETAELAQDLSNRQDQVGDMLQQLMTMSSQPQLAPFDPNRYQYIPTDEEYESSASSSESSSGSDDDAEDSDDSGPLHKTPRSARSVTHLTPREVEEQQRQREVAEAILPWPTRRDSRRAAKAGIERPALPGTGSVQNTPHLFLDDEFGPAPESAGDDAIGAPSDALPPPEKWQSLVSDLRTQLRAYRERLSTLEDEKSRSANEVRRMRSLLTRHEERLKAREAELQQVREQKRQLQEEYNHTMDEKNKLWQRATLIEKEKGRLEADVARFREEAKLARFQLDEKLAEQNSYDTNIDELHRHTQLLESGAVSVTTLRELQMKLAQRTKQVQDLHTESVISKERINALEQERDIIQMNSETSQRTEQRNAKAFEEKINTIMTSLSQQRGRNGAGSAAELSEIEVLKAQLAQEAARYVQLRTQSQRQIDTLRSQLASKNHALKDQVSKFKASVQEVMDSKRLLDGRITELETERDSLLQSVKLAEEQMTSVKSQFGEMHAEVSSLNRQLANLNTEKLLSTQTIETLKREKSQLKESLDRIDVEKKRAVDERNQFSQQLITILSQFQQQGKPVPSGGFDTARLIASTSGGGGGIPMSTNGVVSQLGVSNAPLMDQPMMDSAMAMHGNTHINGKHMVDISQQSREGREGRGCCSTAGTCGSDGACTIM
jgi:hypothetical protein